VLSGNRYHGSRWNRIVDVMITGATRLSGDRGRWGRLGKTDGDLFRRLFLCRFGEEHRSARIAR
jgi:hypothetical protein